MIKKRSKTEYNYIHIIRDIILFRVKLDDIILAKKISKLYDSTLEFNIKNLRKLLKYKPSQFVKCIQIHNRYVVNESDKIDFDKFLEYIEKYMKNNKNNNNVIFNKLLFQLIHNLLAQKGAE